MSNPINKSHKVPVRKSVRVPRKPKEVPPKKVRGEPKFKSKFEQLIYNTIKQRGHEVQYEPDKFEYVIPESRHKYNPDFKISDGVYIETKGIFSYADRQKMLLVKEQNPHLNIYICFMNANNKIRKGSKVSYADWCDKYGFEYCHAPKGIPEEWFKLDKEKS